MEFLTTPSQQELVAKAMAGTFPLDLRPTSREFWQAAGELGWLGLCLPPQLSGGGHDALTAALAYEALGKSGVSRSALFSMGAHLFGCGMAIARHAGESVQTRWGKLLADGSAVGALAFTEPGGGSESAPGNTVVRFDGDTAVLTGEKHLVSNGLLADIVLVSAAHDGATSSLQSSVFVVPTASEGVCIEHLPGQIGLKDAPVARLIFNEVRLSSLDLLGSKGQGLGIVLSVMAWERSCILAGFIGAAERDHHAVSRYLATRRNSRGPLLSNQSVLHALAEIRVELEAARLLLYRGAWALDRNEDLMLFPAMSKLKVSRTIVETASRLQELMAGAGWLDALGIATALADVMGTLSASGTSNMQLNAIGSRLTRR